MKPIICNCLTFLANSMAKSIIYEDCWKPEYCCKKNREAFDIVNKALLRELDWDNLTEDDCKELRLGVWDKNEPLRLIPIWLSKAIPVGTKLTSIDGSEITFDGNNIDTDTRFGCLAWGIIPKANN